MKLTLIIVFSIFCISIQGQSVVDSLMIPLSDLSGGVNDQRIYAIDSSRFLFHRITKDSHKLHVFDNQLQEQLTIDLPQKGKYDFFSVNRLENTCLIFKDTIRKVGKREFLNGKMVIVYDLETGEELYDRLLDSNQTNYIDFTIIGEDEDHRYFSLNRGDEDTLYRTIYDASTLNLVGRISHKKKAGVSTREVRYSNKGYVIIAEYKRRFNITFTIYNLKGERLFERIVDLPVFGKKDFPYFGLHYNDAAGPDRFVLIHKDGKELKGFSFWTIDFDKQEVKVVNQKSSKKLQEKANYYPSVVDLQQNYKLLSNAVPEKVLKGLKLVLPDLEYSFGTASGRTILVFESNQIRYSTYDSKGNYRPGRIKTFAVQMYCFDKTGELIWLNIINRKESLPLYDGDHPKPGLSAFGSSIKCDEKFINMLYSESAQKKVLGIKFGNNLLLMQRKFDLETGEMFYAQPVFEEEIQVSDRLIDWLDVDNVVLINLKNLFNQMLKPKQAAFPMQLIDLN